MLKHVTMASHCGDALRRYFARSCCAKSMALTMKIPLSASVMTAARHRGPYLSSMYPTCSHRQTGVKSNGTLSARHLLD